VQADFAKLTRRTPRDPAAEQAFLAAKLHTLQTHPTLQLAQRQAAVATLAARLKRPPARRVAAPVPGGVGYGMFYDPGFKSNFATGTAIYWEIICPTPPGGNVNTWLYLTATNRAAKGVEAFVAYDGQTQAIFKVYDWARPSPWQTNVPLANLGNYLRTASAHGSPYPVLPLLNLSAAGAASSWYNQVWLWDHAANRWDLIYQYAYSATPQDQTAGWVGSWGPIVETFQDHYQGTQPMGALSTRLLSRDSKNQWGAWHLLASADSYLRTDNKGLRQVFLDPNHSWAVNS
jgi:hypothetical protein